VKLLYFAWVRQKTGCSEETVELPSSVTTAGELAAWLRGRGAGYGEAFADLSRMRVAINQEHASLGAAVTNADEVAYFPPVTGG
jgi:molybdopterin synthase sulfur carrier subunit